jgi:translation initiation factor IF-2
MSSKQINKTKDSKVKVIRKKKSASSVKTKGVSIKKDVKKISASSLNKTVNAKTVLKKTDVKFAKTKAVKITPNDEKSVKKTTLKRKKSKKKQVTGEHAVKKEDSKKKSKVSKAIKEKKEQKIDTVNIMTVEDQKSEEVHISSLVVKIIKDKNCKQSIQKPTGLKQSSVKHEETKNQKIEVFRSGTDLSDDKGIVLINEFITVKDLAEKMKLKVSDVLKKLLSMGSLATINQRLDTDIAILLTNELGYDAKFKSIYSDDKIDIDIEEDISKLKLRPPVVTIMGHVDHGKTSLLDVIRSSNIVAGEHGGITQHIGAYRVKMPSGEYISFLDTPGHEVFTAMRSRGAQVTDIIVLVVSATDGVMPQTVEAINHAKAANVPIIVAVNKIDLPASDPQKIRQELSSYNLIPEEWGGDTIIVDISAKQKTNIDSLLEAILLKTEMMELKANPDKNAEGIVIEAKLDSRKGPVATLLIQSGTLKIGDNLVIGTTYGKVRAITDEYGKRLSAALPSTPIEILGVNEPPQVGDKFIVVDHELRAREIAQSRKEKIKEASLKPRHHLSLADISLGQAKDLRVILKTDVQGSLGALSDALERLSTSEINLKIIHRGAGAITESDVALAVASDALIIGFNLRPETAVEKLAETERVSINIYRIIYDLIADV